MPIEEEPVTFDSLIATGLVTSVVTLAVAWVGAGFVIPKSKPVKLPVRIGELEKEMVEFKKALVLTGEQGKQNETKIDEIIEMVRELK